VKTTQKTAPKFAKKLRDLLGDAGKTQRQIADECGISSSAINRLCKDGIGSENHICIVLHKYNLKRRRMIELLADRRAELSDGLAEEVWKNFRYAFLDEEEYLKEICPFPLERGYACTHFGIHICDVVALAKRCGISNISEKDEININKLMTFLKVFEENFGEDARKMVLAPQCESFPPVLLLDFNERVDVSDYLKLEKCEGKLLFGLPHLVIGDYKFSQGGAIKPHRNTGGIEFLCSLEGNFELNYENVTYPAKLTSGRTIFVLDARKRHAIKFLEGETETGRLLMVRFYPQRTEIVPGKPRRFAPRKT
jgi:transcriptional regulator with XRE-family HTH domain